MNYNSEWKIKVVRWLNREKINFLFDTKSMTADFLVCQKYIIRILFYKEKFTKILQDSLNEKEYNELLKTLHTFENNYNAMKAMLELDDSTFYTVFDKNKLCHGDYSKEYLLTHLNKMEKWFESYQRYSKNISSKSNYWKDNWKKKRFKYCYLNNMLIGLYVFQSKRYNSLEELFSSDYSYNNALKDCEFIEGIAYGVNFGLISYGFKFDGK